MIESNKRPQLILFYDGTCPLCVNEMRQLAKYDKESRIKMEDINLENFSERFPQIDKERANQILHAQEQNGQLLLGLDATVKAWQLVNKHNWLKILRWPVIKTLADCFYLFFAYNRYWISFLLTGESRCEQCVIEKRKPTQETAGENPERRESK